MFYVIFPPFSQEILPYFFKQKLKDIISELISKDLMGIKYFTGKWNVYLKKNCALKAVCARARVQNVCQ